MRDSNWRMTLHRRLLKLGYYSYADYLKSGHWTDLRKRFFRSGLQKHCFCSNRRVQLHHRTYCRLGREFLNDLVAMCDTHHKLFHDYMDSCCVGSLEYNTAAYYQTRAIAEKRSRREGREPEATFLRRKRRKRRGIHKGDFLFWCQVKSLPEYILLLYLCHLRNTPPKRSCPK